LGLLLFMSRFSAASTLHHCEDPAVSESCLLAFSSPVDACETEHTTFEPLRRISFSKSLHVVARGLLESVADVASVFVVELGFRQHPLQQLEALLRYSLTNKLDPLILGEIAGELDVLPKTTVRTNAYDRGKANRSSHFKQPPEYDIIPAVSCNCNVFALRLLAP